MRIKNWDIFIFVIVYHLLLVVLAPFAIRDFSWTAFWIFFVTNCIGGLSITVGYHRLFSHKTYSAHPFFETVILLTSTLAFQWSAYAWSHDHRKHHNHVDTELDPYSIKKGFWYAHMLWLFDYDRTIDKSVVADLEQNPRVMFQHKHFLALTWIINLAILGVACIWLSPLTALFYSFVLRVFTVHHSTWFINSLAHTWGSKTYAKELTAVDNAVLAVLTFGEGYHNYHHAFANDYRNGIRWWHFDPTKWIVWSASKLGMVKNLKKVDRIRLQKILVKKDKQMILERVNEESGSTAGNLATKLNELAHAFDTKASLLNRKYAESRKTSKSKSEKKLIRVEIKHLQQELAAIWKAWIATTRIAGRLFQLSHAH